MNTNKLIKKLDGFFNLSKKKQNEKSEKLQTIIENLEGKRDKLEIEVLIEKENHSTGERFHELENKLSVINNLIEKARLHISQLEAGDNLPTDPESSKPSN